DHIRSRHRAVELRGLDFDFSNVGRAQVLENRSRNLLSGIDVRADSNSRTRAAEVGCVLRSLDRPRKLAVLHVDGVDGIEGLEDLLIRAQAERAQEDRTQELALAIDADVEDVLLVVLEFHPRPAVRNDLAKEVGAV